MQVVSAVLKKLTSASTLLNNYSSILNSLSGMFRTSLSYEEITSLVQMQISDMANWEISTYSTGYTAGWDYTYSMPGWKLWVAYPNASSVSGAKSRILSVMG